MLLPIKSAADASTPTPPAINPDSDNFFVAIPVPIIEATNPTVPIVWVIKAPFPVFFTSNFLVTYIFLL